MKIILIIIVFIYSAQAISAQGQAYDDEVISNACTCIYNSNKENIDSIANTCLAKALLYSLEKEGITQEKIMKDYAENPEAANQTSFGMYLEMLYKNCWATQIKVEKKQTRYYKASDSEQANQYYREGLDYENQGKTDHAILSLEKALSYDSLFVPALNKAGILYEKMNNPDKALGYFRKSLQIFPEGDTAIRRTGTIYLQKGEYQQALKTFTDLIKYYPKNPDGYFGLGCISFMTRDYPSTVRLMKYIYPLCLEKKSDYTRDCLEYLKASYYYMKKEGSESLFMEIAGEFAPKIYQPENFDQLQNIQLDGEIDCRIMEPQILICDDYILSTPVDESDKNRTYAIAAVRKWMEKTPDYIFHVDKNVSRVLDKKGSVLSIFLAAMTRFSIENPEKGNNLQEVALYAWNRFLDYAEIKANNIEQSGEIKKMIKARKNGKLEKQLGYQ